MMQIWRAKHFLSEWLSLEIQENKVIVGVIQEVMSSFIIAKKKYLSVCLSVSAGA